MSGASHPWKIPDTWVWVRIGEVADVVGGGTPPTTNLSNFDGGTVPWVTPADLSGYVQKYISRGKRNITTAGLKNSAARLLPKGTVLFSSRAPIGYVAVASNPLSTNQGFKSFVLPAELDPEYVYYYLQRAKHLAVALSSGTTFQEISGRKAAQLPLPIATQGDQHRTVESIESYLTRLDDAVATLERVQRNLKRYRASVLKAAVEGRLVPTEAELSRAEGRDYEPASVLLQRILAERRRRWEEAELAKMKARGKAPKGDRWKAKYEEPITVDTTPLPELPEGWCWASMSALTVWGPQNGLYVPKSRYGSGTAILRIDDYQVDWSRPVVDLQCIEISADDQRTYGLQVGDIVINRVNSPSHLGKSLAVLERHLPAVFESNMMRFGLSKAVLPSYIQRYLSSVAGKARLTSNAKWAVNQASINQRDVGATPVPLPPEREQPRIMAEVDRLLSSAQDAEAIVGTSVARCARLRQSILKWAFEGRLVDQDPTDEPASALLERIQAERETERGKAGRRGKRARWQRAREEPAA